MPAVTLILAVAMLGGSTTQLIGTMTNLGQGNYQGQFSWPVNPGYIDIKSSGGAILTTPIPTVNA
jgi:hypothetical protein